MAIDDIKLLPACERKFLPTEILESWQVEVEPSDSRVWPYPFYRFVSELIKDAEEKYGTVAISGSDHRGKNPEIGSVYFYFPNEPASTDFREMVLDKYDSRRKKTEFLGGVWIREVEGSRGYPN